MPTAAAAAAKKPAAETPDPGRIMVRRLLPSDSLEELTMLLHRAYAGQIAMGLRPLAGRQDVEMTAKRCASGECYVAVVEIEEMKRWRDEETEPSEGEAKGNSPAPALPPDSCSMSSKHPLAPVPSPHDMSVSPSHRLTRLVGTILFHEVEDAKGPPWFARSDVDSFSQFAVDPDLQGAGIGRMLLEQVERRAAECGAKELGLSMAEADIALMQFYLRRGYRLIERWVWPYTNYRSAILSKKLVE
jgi:GNAT superfamily N-acetyltransferase